MILAYKLVWKTAFIKSLLKIASIICIYNIYISGWAERDKRVGIQMDPRTDWNRENVPPKQTRRHYKRRILNYSRWQVESWGEVLITLTASKPC